MPTSPRITKFAPKSNQRDDVGIVPYRNIEHYAARCTRRVYDMDIVPYKQHTSTGGQDYDTTHV